MRNQGRDGSSQVDPNHGETGQTGHETGHGSLGRRLRRVLADGLKGLAHGVLADEIDRLIDEREQAAENADLGIRLLTTGEGVIRGLAHTLCEQQAKADRLQAEVDSWVDAAKAATVCFGVRDVDVSASTLSEAIANLKSGRDDARAEVERLEAEVERRRIEIDCAVTERDAARTALDAAEAERNDIAAELTRNIERQVGHVNQLRRDLDYALRDVEAWRQASGIPRSDDDALVTPANLKLSIEWFRLECSHQRDRLRQALVVTEQQRGEIVDLRRRHGLVHGELNRLRAERDALQRRLAGPATMPPAGVEDAEPAQMDGRGVGYAPTTTSERSLTVTFKREEHGQRPLIVEPSADQVQRYGGDGTPEPEPERTWTGVLAGCIHVEMGEAVLLPSEARCSWTCHHGQRCIKKAGHDELHDYLGCACANPDAWCGRCDTPLGRRPTQGEVDVTCSGCGAVVALTPPHDPMGEG